MSTSTRRLGYYSVQFYYKDDIFFKKEEFIKFLNEINGMEDIKKVIQDPKTNKAIILDKIIKHTANDVDVYKLIFRSCKYNHSPQYMSSIDGQVRDSDKQLFEGENELTHVVMKITDDEVFTIHEERRSGVLIGALIKYMNKLLKMYHEKYTVTENERYGLTYTLITHDDFEDSLNAIGTINMAEIYIDKRILGSEFFSLMDPVESVKEDFVCTIKAKKSESLIKSSIKKLFSRISTSGTEIKRIRVRGKDVDKLNVVIDSMNLKRVDEIVVNLNKDGTVNSDSIFKKMMEIIKDY